MEIQVGEYVRTNQGYIGKLEDIDKEFMYFDNVIMCYYEKAPLLPINMKLPDGTFLKAEDYIVKHSFNIIDLIEKGDFVKLEYYVAKYKKRITRFFEISKIDGWQFVGLENEHCHFTYDLEKNRWLDGKGYNPKIKSIVTKQQMEAMEYEVK